LLKGNFRSSVRRALFMGSVVIFLGAVLYPCSSSAALKQVFDQTYPFASGGTLLLDNVNGSVQVDGWNKEAIEVRAVKLAGGSAEDLDQVQIDVEGCSRELSVRTRYPKGTGADVLVEYHVYVPYRILLGAVHTVNGSVLVRGVDGKGELRSVNGNVEVVDSAGRFSEHTTNGNVRMELRRLEEGNPVDIATVNGSVTVGLPADADADLKVLSFNGDFDSELPIGSTHMTSPRGFRGRIGSGGSEVSVRTTNGGVHLFLERPRI
jgi:hypothetical protein